MDERDAASLRRLRHEVVRLCGSVERTANDWQAAQQRGEDPQTHYGQGLARHAWVLYETVQNVKRTLGGYNFLRTSTQADPLEPEFFTPAEALDEIAKAIHNASPPVLKVLQAGATLYRGRPHGPEENPTSPTELGSAPVHKTRDTRMSPAGISMFYAAEDRATVVAETPVGSGRQLRCGEWTTTADLNYLDLALRRPTEGCTESSERNANC